jgi:uncharacterized membrane protein (UPF0127 family)
MIRRAIIGIITIIILVVLGVVGYNYFKSKGVSFFSSATATAKDHRINLILAKSAQEKEVGLSSRTSLDQDQGMLFPFDKPDYYSFWMRDMKMPIDILFINGTKIVTIYKNVAPPASSTEELPIYKPKEPADKVLELKAGGSDQYGLKEGDQITFSGI